MVLLGLFIRFVYDEEYYAQQYSIKLHIIERLHMQFFSNSE